MRRNKITISLREFRRISAYRAMINASDPRDLIILDDKGREIEPRKKMVKEWKLSGLNTWDFLGWVQYGGPEPVE